MRGGTSRPARPERPSSWDPLQDLMILKDRMNRLFEVVLRKGGDLADGQISGWSPAVDLRENREGFTLAAELPGVPRESITVRVEGGALILRGDRPIARETRDAEILRVERFYGPFTRTFHLLAPIEERKITARFHRGVLEVSVPKSTKGRSAAVDIPVS